MEYFCCRFAGRRIYTSFTLTTTHLEGAHQVLVNAHHASSIIELATIVRRRKHSYKVTIREKLVTIFYHLVRSTHQIEVVLLKEVRHNVRRKRVAHASVIDTPTAEQLAIWVRPQQIAQQTLVRDIAGPLDVADHAYRRQLGRESAMHTDDSPLDQRAHRETLEAVRKQLPKTNIISPLALVVEAVNAVDGVRLVVPSQYEKVLRVFDFICEQQANRLDALFTAIDVIPKRKRAHRTTYPIKR